MTAPSVPVRRWRPVLPGERRGQVVYSRIDPSVPERATGHTWGCTPRGCWAWVVDLCPCGRRPLPTPRRAWEDPPIRQFPRYTRPSNFPVQATMIDYAQVLPRRPVTPELAAQFAALGARLRAAYPAIDAYMSAVSPAPQSPDLDRERPATLDAPTGLRWPETR